MSMLRSARALAAAGLFAAALLPLRAAAQADSAAAVRAQAISILPIHAVIGFYAGDYERAISPTSTLGLGASWFDLDAVKYSSAEVKFRYYPSGDPLQGLSFGVTAGPTFLSGDVESDEAADDGAESITAVGVGFELARSHILGVDKRLYYAYGTGAKRLIFLGDEGDGREAFFPTLRLSVGYAF